MSKYDIYKWFS